MNYNKITLILFLICSATFAFGQKSNLRKAEKDIQQFEDIKSTGELSLGIKNLRDGKEAIDKAKEHDKTKDLPETWVYAALIEANRALAIEDEKEDAVKNAKEAIAKAKELDDKEKFAENIDVAQQILGQVYFNSGVKAWEAEDFANAYTNFDNALEFLPGDTTLIYYGGIAAIQNQDYDNAVKKYEEILPFTDFTEHKTVSADLPKLYLSKQDTAKALEYAKKATQAYPDDNDIAVQNIELNLMTGNEDQVISDIEEQVSKDPQNDNLFYYLGIARSASGDVEKSREAYKKALEINPDHAEANMNIAVNIMNSVREDLNAMNANRELSNDEYAAGLEKIKEDIQEALPYLKKSTELNPNDIDSWRNIKSYYDFMQDEEKSKEVQAKIDSLN